MIERLQRAQQLRAAGTPAPQALAGSATRHSAQACPQHGTQEGSQLGNEHMYACRVGVQKCCTRSCGAAGAAAKQRPDACLGWMTFKWLPHSA